MPSSKLPDDEQPVSPTPATLPAEGAPPDEPVATDPPPPEEPLPDYMPRTPSQYKLKNPASALALKRRRFGGVGAAAVGDDYIAVGRSSTEFAVLSEQTEGQWNYAVRAVDVAGNIAPWAYVSLLLTPPENYFLLDHLDDIIPFSVLDKVLGFDGQNTSVGDLSAPKFIAPYDTNQTWQNHFTSNSWASPQAQVDAGFPTYVLPAFTDYTATIIWTHDFGEIIPQVRLTLAPAYVVLSGDPIFQIDIQSSLDGIYWDGPWSGPTAIIPQNTRYLQVIVNIHPGPYGGVIPDNPHGMVMIDSIGYTLDVHYVTDQGIDVVHTSAGPVGTYVPFHIPFLFVLSVQATPASANIAYANFEITGSPPTGITLYGFDIHGAPVATGSISWTARGY